MQEVMIDRGSRRQFLKTCLYLAAAGCGSSVLGLCGGCKQEKPKGAPGYAESPAVARSASPGANIRSGFEPAYLKLHRTGELKGRGEELWGRMKKCDLCPRACGANRLEGQRGFCQSTSQLEVSSYHPHHGEERCLVGSGGSGTIFLTNCSLRCVFCINWEISQGGQGSPASLDALARMMIALQERGCHNINIVTPTHYSPHILLGIDRAAGMGLQLPVVYNTCGWERMDILKALEGIVDIYMPDFKYSDGSMSAKFSSGAAAYPEETKAAILEMHRQVGVACPAADGLLYRGLIIRHLVMPNRVAGTKKVVEWIAANLPKDTYVNIMSQYTPTYKAFEHKEIARRITRAEYGEALRWARETGLTRIDTQRTPLL
jgi:putative pyruvate formate lyase activating enzyme